MSRNDFFGYKKRNSSILYGVDQAKVTTASSVFQRDTSQSHVGNPGDGFPPNKRYKSHTATEPEETDDPFEDNDDFTADDLEEIDIIASQALTQDASLKAKALRSDRNAEVSFLPNNTFKTLDQIKQWNIPPRMETASVGQFGSSKEEAPSKDKFRLETLQAQYEEATEKLKKMQDEVLMKNGEIKILRDSMQQMESALEEQRKARMLLENENAQSLNEKEKEFSRKLQSLQSELQFKEAEMNELRTKLLNFEKIKPVSPSVSNNSPQKSPPKTPKVEGCTQSEKNSFPTKGSFQSQILPKSSSSRTALPGDAPLVNKDCKMPDLETEPLKPEMRYICVQRPGSLLISALMKQPVIPGSSLGLCHLLSRNIEEWPAPVTQSTSFNIGSTRNFGDRIASCQEEEVSMRIAQKLALTGLNLIAVDEGSLEESSEESKRGASHTKYYKIPGAVYLLPLMEHHITSYHEALLLMAKAGNTSSGNQSVYSSRSSSSAASSIDDFLPTLEEFALASLGILYYLVFYSWEVVCTLLSPKMKQDCGSGCTEVPEKDTTVACSKQCSANPQEPNPELDIVNVDCSQQPLFKKLLQLLASCATGCQRGGIMNQCLRVLVKLAERSTVDLLLSFQHLLNTQTPTLLRCLSSENPLFAVHLTVRLLTLLAERQELAAKFCSSSETCLLLAVYMYITSRPDKSASEMLWLQLEQETVRFLTKCVQCCSLSVVLVGTDCQCNSEVVKALIIMLHRQWLTVRKVEGKLFDVQAKQIIQFLQSTVLLLHSLSQRDKLFHEHCLEVLHQYDHVMPGLRAILRKTENLKACEELALDELYPLEQEADDQEMECS
ncbi:ATR-interacting protein isoform X1 [Pogona vitticeps]